MKQTGNYQIRAMAGEWVLMPQGEFLLYGENPVIVNETVADLIGKIGDGCEEDALYRYCVDEYGIDMETARTEIGKMLEDLLKKGVLAE